jgi:hypothetical protein
MRPENDLLLSCVRAAFQKNRPLHLPAALPENMDWERFIGLCEWHNAVPLVYRALPAFSPGEIPPAAMNRLRGLCHNNTARALFLASELSRILNALKSCGVPAYPFKGPALSVMLYGDPARRQSKDLDILVPKERVRQAIDCLDSLGYGAKASLAGARLAAHRRTEYELPFFRRDGKLNVELQWAVVPGFFGFDHERLGIWSLLEMRGWKGHALPILPPEETLLLLCVHGAKHFWCKLGWICDVAGLLESTAPPDLPRTLELARRCGVTRLLHLGLLLAERLTGAQLPQEISARIDADLMAASLARRVLAVISDSPVNPDVNPARYLFYLKTKERRRDQLLLAGRLMATLAAGEWNPSRLPDSLYPLYYVLRPLDLLRRHAGAQLGHLRAASKP